MSARQVSRELLDDFHIFGIAFRNVWLHHLEYARLAPAGLRIVPSERNHRANARLCQDLSLDLDLVRFDFDRQLRRDDFPDLTRPSRQKFRFPASREPA